MQSQIEKVRIIEQEILDEIHEVCIQNGLTYSLMYGSLLGAVRHGGFIPWDDDADVMMPRADYDRFVSRWKQKAHDGYCLLDGDCSIDYTNNFVKIVKDRTTFLQSEADRKRDFHKGIYVDVFPCDAVAPAGIRRVLQYCACAVELLYTRGYTSGTRGMIGMIERILLLVPRKFHRKLRGAANRIVTKWNGNGQLPLMCPCTIRECRVYFPQDMFDQMGTICFHGKEYGCVREPERILKLLYGDYRKLPPEAERVWTHHPILIDFEHNYEELAACEDR